MPAGVWSHPVPFDLGDWLLFAAGRGSALRIFWQPESSLWAGGDFYQRVRGILEDILAQPAAPGFAGLGELFDASERLPLGYVAPVYNTALYGLFVGTNSFAIPYPERLAPTFEILGRAGPYEMAAFCLAAAATATWSIFEVRRLFQTVPERRRPQITPAQVSVLLLAVAILAFAAWREASMIIASAG